MTETSKWGNIRIRQDLIDRVSKILEIEEIKKKGFTNISHFTDYSLRQAMQELEQTRFNNISTYDDHVKILDNKIGKLGMIISIHFKKNNNLWCDYCDETDCIHVQYVQEIPQVKSILEKLSDIGLKSLIVKDEYIEIFDKNIRKGIPVKISYSDKKLYCTECESFNCNHVKYVWSVDHISSQLQERGLVTLEKTCPKCGTVAKETEINDLFGYRKSKGKIITQSWCRYCRTKHKKPLENLSNLDK